MPCPFTGTSRAAGLPAHIDATLLVDVDEVGRGSRPKPRLDVYRLYVGIYHLASRWATARVAAGPRDRALAGASSTARREPEQLIGGPPRMWQGWAKTRAPLRGGRWQ